MRWLLLRRGGLLLGVPAAGVLEVRRRGRGVAIRLAGGEVAADGVEAGLARLRPQRVPCAVASRIPLPLTGLAVHRGEPVLLLDAAALGREAKEDGDGETRRRTG